MKVAAKYITFTLCAVHIMCCTIICTHGAVLRYSYDSRIFVPLTSSVQMTQKINVAHKILNTFNTLRQRSTSVFSVAKRSNFARHTHDCPTNFQILLCDLFESGYNSITISEHVHLSQYCLSSWLIISFGNVRHVCFL